MCTTTRVPGRQLSKAKLCISKFHVWSRDPLSSRGIRMPRDCARLLSPTAFHRRLHSASRGVRPGRGTGKLTLLCKPLRPQHRNSRQAETCGCFWISAGCGWVRQLRRFQGQDLPPTNPSLSDLARSRLGVLYERWLSSGLHRRRASYPSVGQFEPGCSVWTRLSLYLRRCHNSSGCLTCVGFEGSFGV